MFDNSIDVVSCQGSFDGERLVDTRYNWRDGRRKVCRLAHLYEMVNYPIYAERAAACCTWLQYKTYIDLGCGEVNVEHRRLQAANFCQLRLCPICTSRRAKKNAIQLSRVMDKVQSPGGIQYIFLTLTVKSVPGSELGDTLGHMLQSWDRLFNQRPVKRAFVGWYRGVEITRRNAGYHPHIHAILAVTDDYFRRGKDSVYITHDDWVARWRQALKIDYNPRVDIRKTEAKGDKSVAIEAAKYVTKDSDYISPKLSDKEAAQVVADYTKALYKRRLMAYGGDMKAAAQELGVKPEGDTDLVHLGDEPVIRDDVAELIETYRWHLGAGDYILAERHVCPVEIRA